MKQTIKLKDLQELFNNKSKYFHSEQKGHQGLKEREYQGEYNEKFIFYTHAGLPEGVFLRDTYRTDSYGDNENVVKTEFVMGVKKQITVFEPIK